MRSALHLYSQLSPAQRQLLLQGGELPVAQMTLAQRSLFLGAMEERSRLLPAPSNPEQPANGTLSLSARPFVIIVERRGEAVRTRLEPAAPPAAGARPPSPRDPGAPGPSPSLSSPA